MKFLTKNIVQGSVVQFRSGGAPLTVVQLRVGGLRLCTVSSGGLMQEIHDVNPDSVILYGGPRIPALKRDA